MKSSSGINIGNGNNCAESRKTATTSFSSPSSSAYINKCVTKTNTVLIKSSNAEKDDVKQEEQQLNEFIQPASSFYTTSISSFKSESISSNFKFEVTPQTINQLNHYQPNIQRRARIQWTKRNASSRSKTQNSSANSSIVFSRTSMDLNIPSTMATNLMTSTPIAPDISITEMTVKDFDDEYKSYTDQTHQQNNNPDDLNKTIQSVSMSVVINDPNNTTIDKEKVFVDQASQAVLNDTKSKKTTRSATYPKKIKSAAKRPKQPSATPITQQSTQPIQSTSSPIRTVSQTDLNTTTVQKSAVKSDDNNAGKNLITVDTTKARSNLEVVRMCIRELAWKEVMVG